MMSTFGRSKTKTQENHVKYLKSDHLSETKLDFGENSNFEIMVWLPVAKFSKPFFCKSFLMISSFDRSKTKTLKNQPNCPQIGLICKIHQFYKLFYVVFYGKKVILYKSRYDDHMHEVGVPGLHFFLIPRLSPTIPPRDFL